MFQPVFFSMARKSAIEMAAIATADGVMNVSRQTELLLYLRPPASTTCRKCDAAPARSGGPFGKVRPDVWKVVPQL